MSKKTITLWACILLVTTTFAEKIVLKPNWNKGDSMFYSVVNYTDTTKTISCDMTIKVLDNSNDYLMSCVYSNYQDFSGMEALAEAFIGKDKYDKIKAYVPHYTVSKEGKILRINNFDEYLKIYETSQDSTNNLAEQMGGILSSILKSLLASDEKSFMEINLKEVLAQHKHFGIEYDTKKETKTTTDITISTINMKKAKAISKAEIVNDQITITTTAKLKEKECIAAINQWIEKYMADTAKETGMDINDPNAQKAIKEMKKEYTKMKVWAEYEETATYDTETGWMISYKSKETFHSSEGESSQSIVITPK